MKLTLALCLGLLATALGRPQLDAGTQEQEKRYGGKGEGKCFPGSARVAKSDGHMSNLAQLYVGDIITTVNGYGDVVPTEVLGFMKRQTKVQAMYKHIVTDSGNGIFLSEDHLIFATNGKNEMISKYARDVLVGDFVQESDMKLSKVVDMALDVMEGAFVPITKEGTILVEGVLASTYAGFDHDLAHFFVTPMRWMPWLFAADITGEGSSPYIDWGIHVLRWIIPQSQQSKPNQGWQFFLQMSKMG